MFTLYIANKNYSSWSLRPWVLMQQLKIPFTEEINEFNAGSNKEVFRNFSPNGMVPCLVDNDLTIWDSLAIIEYLAELYDNIWPSSLSARSWARSASAEMHSGFYHLRNQCPMNCGLRIKLNHTSKELQQDIDRIDELLSQGLCLFSGPFLAGEKFTAVDAFYAPVIFRIQTYGINTSPQVQKYMAQMLSIDAMKLWYQQALEEKWREPGHENEAKESGTITHDFRL